MFLPLLLLSLVATFARGQEYPDLEGYNVDPESLSVSGLSSGGYFTNNFFVINSGHVKGAAIFAGMPYGCSRVFLCDDPQDMVAYAEDLAGQGLIDPVENLRDKPVYIFHGTSDWMVGIGQAERINAFYQHFGSDIDQNVTSDCGHGIPSLDYGVVCQNTWLPGVNNCGWSGGFVGMQHIYKDLVEPEADQPMDGQFIEYNQTEFWADEVMHSFDDAGYVYIPTACQDRQTVCRLHVVFHGCFINRWLILDDYARNAGYNPTAEINNIIVLYPQLRPDLETGNAAGCWDSFGITGDNFDRKTGVQVRVVQKMIDRITGAENK